ncbi:MAG: hypothetical protein IJA68_00235 [Clostridia bacterium]|nr:hypothetical protein [Clostridia bacterium]
MKKYIVGGVAGALSLFPLYILIVCVISLIEMGLTRNLAVAHILPSLLCTAGLWTVMIDGFRNALCRRTWWIGGVCVLLGIGLELAFWLPLL